MGGKGKDRNDGAPAGDRPDRPERPRPNGKGKGSKGEKGEKGGKGPRAGKPAPKPVVEEPPKVEKKEVVAYFSETKSNVREGMSWASALRSKKEKPAEPEVEEVKTRSLEEPETTAAEPWPETTTDDTAEDAPAEPEPAAAEPAKEAAPPAPAPTTTTTAPAAAAAAAAAPAKAAPTTTTTTTTSATPAASTTTPTPTAKAVAPPLSRPAAAAAAAAPRGPSPSHHQLHSNAPPTKPTPSTTSAPAAAAVSLPSAPPAAAAAEKKVSPEEKAKKSASKRFHDQTESVVLPFGFNAPTTTKAKISFSAVTAPPPPPPERVEPPALEKKEFPAPEWRPQEDTPVHVAPATPPKPQHVPQPSQYLSQLQQQMPQQDYSRQYSETQHRQSAYQDHARQQQSWTGHAMNTGHTKHTTQLMSSQMPKASPSTSTQQFRYDQRTPIGPSRSQLPTQSSMTGGINHQSAIAASMSAMGAMPNMSAMRGTTSNRSNYYQNQGAFDSYAAYPSAYQPSTYYNSHNYAALGGSNYGGYGRENTAYDLQHSQGHLNQQHLSHQQQQQQQQHQQQGNWARQQRSSAGAFGGLNSGYRGGTSAFWPSSR